MTKKTHQMLHKIVPYIFLHVVAPNVKPISSN